MSNTKFILIISIIFLLFTSIDAIYSDYGKLKKKVKEYQRIKQNVDKILQNLIESSLKPIDHIGAFRHIIPKLPAPVYGTKFTLGMLQRTMEETDGAFTPEYHELNPENHDTVQLCDSFSIELVRVNHSIPDTMYCKLRSVSALRPIKILLRSLLAMSIDKISS